MSDNVVDLNSIRKDEELEHQIPEGTVAALNDPGWIGASLFIAEVGSQIFGGSAVISAIPDPEGWNQQQAGKEKWMPGVFVEVSSLAVQGLGASMVVPYNVEAYADVRRVFAELMVGLKNAEAQKMSGSQLLVPENAGKLIVPGK